MKHVADILRGNSVNSNNSLISTVNSKDKSLDTDNSIPVSEEIEALLKERGITPEGVAELLSEMLDDKKSLSYYLILAKEHNPGRLLEAAHITKNAYKQGKIRKTKPIYFIAILRRWELKTKFRKI